MMMRGETFQVSEPDDEPGAIHSNAGSPRKQLKDDDCWVTPTAQLSDAQLLIKLVIDEIAAIKDGLEREMEPFDLLFGSPSNAVNESFTTLGDDSEDEDDEDVNIVSVFRSSHDDSTLESELTTDDPEIPYLDSCCAFPSGDESDNSTVEESYCRPSRPSRKKKSVKAKS
jgi:hypothetical protein